MVMDVHKKEKKGDTHTHTRKEDMMMDDRCGGALRGNKVACTDCLKKNLFKTRVSSSSRVLF